jgi:NADH dehydrogenase FAD-containing subunit
MDHTIANAPRVVIVGGGFGGLAAARALRKADAQVILIDRANHHVFQPLLYEVATSLLMPGQIVMPIRSLLRRQRNASVILGEVTGIDAARRAVRVDMLDRKGVPIAYDYLVLATGMRDSYFGHDEFEPFAPGLKTIADALRVRDRILLAFERAEVEEDAAARRELLTFVMVGAGPTGVEMASAIAMLVHTTLRREFRRIDPAAARILLIDMAPRVLGSFHENLSAAVQRRLERLGVELRLGQGVERVDERGVVVAGERIAARTVIWTAGVAPSPAGQWLDARTDGAGRVVIGADLTVPGRDEIFVVGDTASLEQDGKPLPGVAQVALQQGRHAGDAIRRRIEGRPAASPFRYWDKGNMAVVGKGFAIMESGRVRASGRAVWVAWLAVHLWAIAQPTLRVHVFAQWAWTLLTNHLGSRLVVEAKREDAPD